MGIGAQTGAQPDQNRLKPRSRIITNWFEAFDLNGNGILGES